MRLTKDEFIAAVNTYERMLSQEEEILGILHGNPEWLPGEWITNYYKLLSLVSNIGEKYNVDLDYFCYDLDFGRNWSEGMITLDGKDMPCRNPEELWGLIMNKKKGEEV